MVCISHFLSHSHRVSIFFLRSVFLPSFVYASCSPFVSGDEQSQELNNTYATYAMYACVCRAHHHRTVNDVPNGKQASKQTSNWFDCMHNTYVLRLRLVTFWTLATAIAHMCTQTSNRRTQKKEVFVRNVWCDVWLLSRDLVEAAFVVSNGIFMCWQILTVVEQIFPISMVQSKRWLFVCVDGVVSVNVIPHFSCMRTKHHEKFIFIAFKGL